MSDKDNQNDFYISSNSDQGHSHGEKHGEAVDDIEELKKVSKEFYDSFVQDINEGPQKRPKSDYDAESDLQQKEGVQPKDNNNGNEEVKRMAGRQNEEIFNVDRFVQGMDLMLKVSSRRRSDKEYNDFYSFFNNLHDTKVCIDHSVAVVGRFYEDLKKVQREFESNSVLIAEMTKVVFDKTGPKNGHESNFEEKIDSLLKKYGKRTPRTIIVT